METKYYLKRSYSVIPNIYEIQVWHLFNLLAIEIDQELRTVNTTEGANLVLILQYMKIYLLTETIYIYHSYDTNKDQFIKLLTRYFLFTLIHSLKMIKAKFNWYLIF